MKTQTHFSRVIAQPHPATAQRAALHRVVIALVLIALLLSLLGFANIARAGTLPATTCTATGPGAVTCELWAKTGTLTFPNSVTVPVWGFTDSAAGAAQVPGPMLIVNQGDAVTVILHNNLTVATSIKFEGQTLPTDRTGAAPSGQATYVFTADRPGTFLYEAGSLAGAQYQAAMGLHGTLIVRPATANQVLQQCCLRLRR